MDRSVNGAPYRRDEYGFMAMTMDGEVEMEHLESAKMQEANVILS